MATERPKTRASPEIRISLPPPRKNSTVSAEDRERDASLILQRLQTTIRPISGKLPSPNRRASCIEFNQSNRDTEDVKTFKGKVKSTERLSGKGLIAADLIKNLQSQNTLSQKRQSSGQLNVSGEGRCVSAGTGRPLARQTNAYDSSQATRIKSANVAYAGARGNQALSVPRPQSENSPRQFPPNMLGRRGSLPVASLKEKRRTANAILQKYNSASKLNEDTQNNMERVPLPLINRVKSASPLCPILHDSDEDDDSNVPPPNQEYQSPKIRTCTPQSGPLLIKRRTPSPAVPRSQIERKGRQREVQSFEITSDKSSSSESESDTDCEKGEEKVCEKVTIKAKVHQLGDRSKVRRSEVNSNSAPKGKKSTDIKQVPNGTKKAKVQSKSSSESDSDNNSESSDNESDEEDEDDSGSEKDTKDEGNKMLQINFSKNNMESEDSSESEDEERTEQIADSLIIDEELEALSKELTAPGMPAMDLLETHERLIEDGLNRSREPKQSNEGGAKTADGETADEVDDLIDHLDDLIDADDEDIAYATKQELKKKSFKLKVKMAMAAKRFTNEGVG